MPRDGSENHFQMICHYFQFASFSFSAQAGLHSSRLGLSPVQGESENGLENVLPSLFLVRTRKGKVLRERES